MLKATRQALSKAPVRPQTHAAKPASANTGTGFRVTPVGIAFILGGLALGSYILKPTTRQPSAAMDTFKPQIAIIFGMGDSKGAFKSTAPKLGFAYIDASKDLGELDKLIQNGKTRFFIEGFKDAQSLDEMSRTVVQPDLVLTFGDAAKAPAPRVIDLGDDADVDRIKEILLRKNLV